MVEIFRPAIVAIFVNDENKVLIGSSPRDGGYKFPQGGIDDGETPFDTVKREVMEELGVVIEDDDIVQMFEEKVWYYYPGKVDPSNRGFVGQEFVVFKIKFRDSMKFEPQDDEFDVLEWIDVSEFEKMDTRHRRDAYKRALELCGLL